MDNIALGRLVWLYDVTDPQGKPVGKHAAIILTTTSEYQAGKPIKAVVVSSKLQHAKKECLIPIKEWTRSGHHRTGFNKPCAVMCGWTAQIVEDHIESYGCLFYGKLLEEIIACVKACEPSTQS